MLGGVVLQVPITCYVLQSGELCAVWLNNRPRQCQAGLSAAFN